MACRGSIFRPSAQSSVFRPQGLSLLHLLRSRVAAHIAANGYAHPSGRLFWGGVKEFADGSLGSCTALMREPYSRGACGLAGGEAEQGARGVREEEGDDAGGESEARNGYGLRMIDMARLRELVEDADKAGLQV